MRLPAVTLTSQIYCNESCNLLHAVSAQLHGTEAILTVALSDCHVLALNCPHRLQYKFLAKFSQLEQLRRHIHKSRLTRLHSLHTTRIHKTICAMWVAE